MHDNVRANLRRWDEDHAWPQDGDEWTGQAQVCGVPYEVWKDSLVQHLIVPYVDARSVVLEIAPGHGRWTEHLARRAGHLIAVDLSPSCLDHCRSRFAERRNVDYVLTTGTALPFLATDRIDVVWSFDAFVHMAPAVIGGYLVEIARVLVPGGTAILHHANVADRDRHRQDDHPGWRSAVDAALVHELATTAGLRVVEQLVYWDEARKIGVPRFDDRITRLARA
jgi:ubiquinone/menaquinone biosynthesis C-methylase UbiE